MKKKCSYIVVSIITVLTPPSYSVWKQLPESPFSIKAEPCNSETNNGPRQVSYSPDGSFLAVANACDSSGSGAESGSISIFAVDQNNGKLTELTNSPFTTETNNKTIGLAFSPLGTPTLSVANREDVTKLFSFNTQTGALSNLRPVNAGLCTFDNAVALAYAPNGQHLASVVPEPSLNIYQANQATGDLTCQQEVTASPIVFPRSVAYYPVQSNLSYLAVTNNEAADKAIVIFTANPDTGIISNQKSFSLRDGTQDIFSHWVDFSPDGRFLAVAVVDGVEVRKFRATGINAPSLLPLNNPTSFFSTPASAQNNAGVRSVTYSPDGRWLAAANANETISIFCVDQETGRLFNRQDLTVGHTGNLGTGDLTFSVIFSPDSRFLAVSNRDDNSISVFTNPNANCPTCNIMLNLSNSSSCTECTSTVN